MIVFCTTCKGRAQHLEQTLPQNIADNSDFANCKFLVLNYNSQDHLLEFLKSFPNEIASGRLVFYSYYDWPTFRMAHAKNMAHRLGMREGGEILVNLDADNFTGKGFAAYIKEKFCEDNVFLWSKMVKDGPDRTPRGISGRIVVTKEAFLNAGGYDEKYETWSPDDKDFNARLRNLAYSAHEIDQRYLLGVMHNDKMRFREYPHAKNDQLAEDFDDAGYCRGTISNYGNFGCGTVFRNFDREPITLSPMPTRIFGIGMHKTGTTSLHTALRELGFDCSHWPSAHWAKAVWQEMKETGKSLTLERSYAATDLPITLLYRELDKAYPGSKFILTTRDEGRWLASVRSHWDPSKNKFRASWDKDPFSHKIHRELYGMKNFDAGVFLERFRRHNAEVADYFKDRPGDLFTMNVDENPKWDGLCRFLGRPVPAVPYPKVYKTAA